MNPSGKWIDGIDPDGSVVEAAGRSLEPRLTSVARALPLAAHLAHHDIEHVHRLRVATRRAVAALKLYAEVVGRKPRRWMKKRLRKIRRAAGDARDLDVLADRLLRDYGERYAPVLQLIADKRAEAQSAIVKMAERCRRKDRFIRKTARLLKSVRAHANDKGAATVFRRWAADRLADVAEPFLSGMPDESADASALHQFRIKAKAVRYTIELVAPAFPDALRGEVYPIVEEIQERLGRIQDHVTARLYFGDWLEKAEEDATRSAIGKLQDEEGRRLEEETREFHNWWSDDLVARLREGLQFVDDQQPATPPPEPVSQT
jgi:CHAD domain-containing protein